MFGDRHRPRLSAAGGGWFGWRCPDCQTVSDALYLTREAAEQSMRGHIASEHHGDRLGWLRSRVA